MKRGFELTFCFKGSRRYVHGTDIFSQLTERYQRTPTNIDIVFHGITVSNMFFSLEKPLGKEVKVIFRCNFGNEKVRLYGIESEKKIDCGYAYEEEKIIENAEIDIQQKSIALKQPTAFSFIEHIVALNKALVETLYKAVEGKWYFTRLQLERNITMNDVASLKLRLQSNFQLKLTKSVLIVNNEEVGHLYFSHIPKVV